MLTTITNTGRAAMAKAMAARPLFLAWGSGDPSWDAMQKEDLPSLVNAQALVNELGRRKPSVVAFCTPDDAGSIVIPVASTEEGELQTARYSLSDVPTPYLYIRADYDFEDAANAVVREIALYMDCKPKEDRPAGQLYFTPDQFSDTGMMFCAQILDKPVNRSVSVRQSVEFVQPI